MHRFSPRRSQSLGYTVVLGASLIMPLELGVSDSRADEPVAAKADTRWLQATAYAVPNESGPRVRGTSRSSKGTTIGCTSAPTPTA